MKRSVLSCLDGDKEHDAALLPLLDLWHLFRELDTERESDVGPNDMRCGYVLSCSFCLCESLMSMWLYDPPCDYLWFRSVLMILPVIIAQQSVTRVWSYRTTKAWVRAVDCVKYGRGQGLAGKRVPVNTCCWSALFGSKKQTKVYFDERYVINCKCFIIL